jgi:hypothetical protein
MVRTGLAALHGPWLNRLRSEGGTALSQVQDLVGLGSAEPKPAAIVEPTVRTIAWATAEGELLRAEVPIAAHDAFVAALRQSQGQDSARLTRMAEQRMLRETEPMLADTATRVPGFVEEVAGSQIGTITGAFSTLDITPDDTPATIADKTTFAVGKQYADLYRLRVLRPDHTLPVLRASAGRVIGAVHLDLIGSCDRYDQAFRSFLRAHVNRAESLNQDGHWTSNPWIADGATFRSLCQTLRATQADESLFDEAVLRVIGEPTMTANDLTRELARPAAQVVGAMATSYEGAVAALSGVGLPVAVAKPPATLWSYGAASPALLFTLLGPGVPAETHTRITAALTKATRDGQIEALQGVNTALATFINGELAGIASAVSARVDKPRRAP